ncbi:hypothetical protein BN1723_009306 [Verticillium longisporum]|uniref:Uncharacterized protein n=1 Tax=Verticillium longisporum TaxID=100787 RepID=A0A0G4KN20_VERLO|nr:hypothetical protein BN1723_009306 [Verticillium longisporum]
MANIIAQIIKGRTVEARNTDDNGGSLRDIVHTHASRNTQTDADGEGGSDDNLSGGAGLLDRVPPRLLDRFDLGGNRTGGLRGGLVVGGTLLDLVVGLHGPLLLVDTHG